MGGFIKKSYEPTLKKEGAWGGGGLTSPPVSQIQEKRNLHWGRGEVYLTKHPKRVCQGGGILFSKGGWFNSFTDTFWGEGSHTVTSEGKGDLGGSKGGRPAKKKRSGPGQNYTLPYQVKTVGEGGVCNREALQGDLQV